MNKIAVSIFLATIVMSVACDDDNNDNLVIIDTDNDGIADDLEQPPPGVIQWNATLTTTDPDSVVTGSSVVRQVEGALSFSATILIRTDVPDAVRPWHVHFGTCATGGDIVGADADYARLTINSDGAALSTARVGVPLDPTLPYHVNVHFSDAEFDRIVACGDYVLQN
jgi:hypothetical protein